MKENHLYKKGVLKNERGWALIVGLVVTLGVTALIGGATLLGIIATRRPVAGALENLDQNKATAEDMQTLQNANNDMVKAVEIAAAGGSLVGSTGQPSAPTSPGGLPPSLQGPIATGIANVIPGIIGRITEQASKPPQTSDNPSGPTTGTLGGYDAGKDLGMGVGMSGTKGATQAGETFQGQVSGAEPKPTKPGDYGTQQPKDYGSTTATEAAPATPVPGSGVILLPGFPTGQTERPPVPPKFEPSGPPGSPPSPPGTGSPPCPPGKHWDTATKMCCD